MVDFYVGRIKRGKLEIDQVPLKWREEVRAKLSEQERHS